MLLLLLDVFLFVGYCDLQKMYFTPSSLSVGSISSFAFSPASSLSKQNINVPLGLCFFIASRSLFKHPVPQVASALPPSSMILIAQNGLSTMKIGVLIFKVKALSLYKYSSPAIDFSGL